METETPLPYLSPPLNSTPRPWIGSPRLWIPVVVCLLAALAVPIAFIVGAVLGNTQIYHKLATHQQSRIESFLREDPTAYGNLRVQHASNGWAFPLGTVETQEDFEHLSKRLHEMFGDELAENMMRGVDVRR